MSNIPGIYFLHWKWNRKTSYKRTGMRVPPQNGLRLENQQWGADHGFAVLNLGPQS